MGSNPNHERKFMCSSARTYASELLSVHSEVTHAKESQRYILRGFAASSIFDHMCRSRQVLGGEKQARSQNF